MIAITFAVPEESSTFRKRLRLVRRDSIPGMATFTGTLGGREIVVAHVGMGLESARKRTRLLLSHVRPDLLIAAGFGGALAPELIIGDVVFDPRENPTLAELAPSIRVGRIVTSPNPMETAADKAALFRYSSAAVVDMETEAIAVACAEAGIPVIGVRAISDAANDALPVPLPAWFDLETQRTRPLVLLGYLLGHPEAVLPFVQFVRRLGKVRSALADGLMLIYERCLLVER
jgi:adenosylhomocysteine nucleosidase